jgi:hypothetical protein
MIAGGLVQSVEKVPVVPKTRRERRKTVKAFQTRTNEILHKRIEKILALLTG